MSAARAAFSLAACVWSADIGRVHQVATERKAGTVWINTCGHTDMRLPWGGAGAGILARNYIFGMRKVLLIISEPESTNSSASGCRSAGPIDHTPP